MLRNARGRDRPFAIPRRSLADEGPRRGWRMRAGSATPSPPRPAWSRKG